MAFYVVWEDDDRKVPDTDGNREMDLVAGFDTKEEAEAYVQGMQDKLGYDDQGHLDYEIEELTGDAETEMRANFEIEDDEGDDPSRAETEEAAE